MAISFDLSWGDSEGTGVTSVASASHNAGASATIIFAGVTVSGGVTLSSVTDNQGSTYTILTPVVTPGGNHVYLAYAINNINTNARTITANLSGTGNAVLMPFSFNGIATSSPFDKYQSAASGSPSGSLDTGNTTTTTFPNEVLIGVGMTDTGSANTWTAGSGFTLGPQIANAPIDSYTEYKIVSATGAYNAPATNSDTTHNWACLIATFADTPISGGGGGPLLMGGICL
jgi:hypothetical protein